jgi:hypothetical protein
VDGDAGVDLAGEESDGVADLIRAVGEERGVESGPVGDPDEVPPFADPDEGGDELVDLDLAVVVRGFANFFAKFARLFARFASQ